MIASSPELNAVAPTSQNNGVMYRLNPDVISAVVGDEAVLLLPAEGVYFGLNQVAARAWQLLGDGMAFDDLITRLLSEFDVDRATIDRDIRALMLRLHELHLVVDSGSDPADGTP